MLKRRPKHGRVIRLPQPIAVKVDWPLLLDELDQSANDKLLEYLVKLNLGGVAIESVQDDKNFNLLHHAVLKG